MRRIEELEGKGQAAYSEGITDTIQRGSLVIHTKAGRASNKLTCIGKVGRRGGVEVSK